MIPFIFVYQQDVSLVTIFGTEKSRKAARKELRICCATRVSNYFQYWPYLWFYRQFECGHYANIQILHSTTASIYPVSQEQVKEKKICFLTLAPEGSTVSFAEYKGVLPPLFKPERRFRKFYCLKLNSDAEVSKLYKLVYMDTYVHAFLVLSTNFCIRYMSQVTYFFPWICTQPSAGIRKASGDTLQRICGHLTKHVQTLTKRPRNHWKDLRIRSVKTCLVPCFHDQRGCDICSRCNVCLNGSNVSLTAGDKDDCRQRNAKCHWWGLLKDYNSSLGECVDLLCFFLLLCAMVKLYLFVLFFVYYIWECIVKEFSCCLLKFKRYD